jgi:hypothetical protein
MSSNKKTLIDGDFQVGSSHFYVDVENNRVGLNQANPASSLDVNGNAFIATDMTIGSNVTVGSNVIAQKFTGSASGLTSVPADQISGVIPVANGGTGTTATTGTGSLVKSDNPTFTGTVTADTFSGSGASLTNIPMGQATGTLAVANGGTGVTTSTGTGNTVLSASPTLTGTVTAETANFSSNISASNIYAGRDTDTTSYLGRAAVGFSGISDEATFAHVDVNSTNNYALKQTATGGTQVNAATGGAVIFSINDSEQARINTTGLGVGTDNPGFKLDVHGTANVGVLYSTFLYGDGSNIENIAGYSWPTHTNGNDIYYTTGNVGIGTATPDNTLEVAGTASVAILKSAADAATTTYNYILNGPRPGTTSDGAVHFINGSTRTEDGGANTYTIRNNSGKLLLGNASYDTILEGGNVSLRVMSGHETEGTLKFSRADGTDRVHNIKVYNSSTQNDNYMKFQIHAGGPSAGTLTDNVLYLRGDGNVGIGTAVPLEKLDVRGTIIAPVVSYLSNQDAAYLIAGTSGYTGAATNWDTHGFQHRIKSNSSGVPRITVDAPSGGEVFTIENGGNVGIGVADPGTALDVNGTVTASSFTGIQTADVPDLAAGKITSGTFDTDLIPELAAGKITSGTFDKARIPSLYTEVDINAPDVTSGTWVTSDSSGSWGDPKFNNVHDKYARNDAPGYRQYNIPSGMKSAYISLLQWSNGGYVDAYGVQSDGGLVFLRRINTRQGVENSNEGNPDQHDGSTITLAGSGLHTFSAIRLDNKSGRLYLTGLAFVPHLEGTEGTGMVHPDQLSATLSASQIPTLNQDTTGSAGSCTGNSATATNAGYATSAGNADTVDDQHAHEMSWGHQYVHTTYNNFNSFINTDKFGAHFVQGSTNSPGGHAGTTQQWYHQRMSLGSEYNQYSLQFAIPRNRSDAYLYYRNEENSAVGSWYKMRAGYADSCGNADKVDNLHSSSFFRRDTTNDVDVRLTAGDGRGLRFWDSDTYKIYMSNATNGTWGGRLDGSDYNMYFRMTSGTTRGFVFLNNRTVRCHINGNGDLYLNGGWLRTYGNTGLYNQTYGGGWFMQDTTYVRCYNNKTVYTGGSFLAGGNVTAYSDIRRKKDLLKIDNALDKVEQLTGYTYTNKKDNKRYTGLIAQDVEKVLPEAVTTESDGHLSLAYGNMMGLLVEAVKELTRKNEILEARLNVIENNR